MRGLASHASIGWCAALAGALAITGLMLAATASAQTTFTNSTSRISINDFQGANPYPSQITVGGLTGTVQTVQVTLRGFIHSAPCDVDILLVSPTLRTALLMSDVTGRDTDCTTPTPATGVTLTFRDDASSALPGENTVLQTGEFRPTNYTDAATPANDRFPIPASVSAAFGFGSITFVFDATGNTPPVPASLATFAGDQPNGVWSLFVIDDRLNSVAGRIENGWELTITTTGGQPITITSPTSSVRPGDNVTFIYTVSPNASQYCLRVVSGPLGALPPFAVPPGGFTAPLPADQPAGTYRIRVEGVGPSQSCAPVLVPGTEKDLTVQAQGQVTGLTVSPATASGADFIVTAGSPVTFTWTAVSSVTAYEVRVRTGLTPVLTQTVSDTNLPVPGASVPSTATGIRFFVGVRPVGAQAFTEIPVCIGSCPAPGL